MPIADIATLTGLDLGPLVAADRLPASARGGGRSCARTCSAAARPAAADLGGRPDDAADIRLSEPAGRAPAAAGQLRRRTPKRVEDLPRRAAA